MTFFNRRNENKNLHDWPELRKAIEDDGFDYALGLHSGVIINFSGAVYCGGTTIYLKPPNSGRMMPGCEHCFERGITVALSGIAWVADAPDGS